MDKKTRKKIFAKRELIKYSAHRAYFGKLTGAGLATAYGLFKHTQDWAEPITTANVVVGHIDNAVICRALWHEMSYNPLRFGKVSPFLYKGKESLYRFCDNFVSQDFPGVDVLEKIYCELTGHYYYQDKKHNGKGYMSMIPNANGGWNAEINAPHGIVSISFVDGHSDNMYKKLTCLRQMIRIIINQNLEDFKRKNYRDQMLNVIAKRHPNGVRDDVKADKKVVLPTEPVVMSAEEIAEDRMDRELESAQITLENKKYVSQAQFEQAQDDIKTIRNMKANGIIR